MWSVKAATYVLPLTLLALITLTPVHASAQPSIPINGRYSVLTIKIYIPPTPKWAHDIVLNATIAWNRAQLWNLRKNPAATIYNFVEADEGTATSLASFLMPAAYASIAVGWTTYTYAPSSGTSIVSTQTYLTPTIFNEAQGSNATARAYAFWLALHELGRVLGLGSILDGKDIMQPTYTPQRVTQTPKLSTLDLYALHVLAQGNAPNFVTLPDGVQDQFTPVTFFLLNSTVSPSGTTNLSSTTPTPNILPTSIASGSSSVTFLPAPSKAQTSSVLAFASFGTVGAIALAVIIALVGSAILFTRRKKTPQTPKQRSPILS